MSLFRLTASEKATENRLRRVADRRGLKLVKNPRRDPYAIDYGMYRLVKKNPQIRVFPPLTDRRWGAYLMEIEAALDAMAKPRPGQG